MSRSTRILVVAAGFVLAAGACATRPQAVDAAPAVPSVAPASCGTVVVSSPAGKISLCVPSSYRARRHIEVDRQGLGHEAVGVERTALAAGGAAARSRATITCTIYPLPPEAPTDDAACRRDLDSFTSTMDEIVSAHPTQLPFIGPA